MKTVALMNNEMNEIRILFSRPFLKGSQLRTFSIEEDEIDTEVVRRIMVPGFFN